MKTLSFVLALAFAAGAWADQEACINYDPGVSAPPRQEAKCRVKLNRLCRITTKLCGRYPGEPHAWCTRYPGAGFCHTFCQDVTARSEVCDRGQCGQYVSQPGDCPAFYKEQARLCNEPVTPKDPICDVIRNLEDPHCKFCPTGHCRYGEIYCEPCPAAVNAFGDPAPWISTCWRPDDGGKPVYTQPDGQVDEVRERRDACCVNPPALIDCSKLTAVELQGLCSFFPEHGCCKDGP
jgi:hypothetical protein